jgi:hypothetical protein
MPPEFGCLDNAFAALYKQMKTSGPGVQVQILIQDDMDSVEAHQKTKGCCRCDRWENPRE